MNEPTVLTAGDSAEWVSNHPDYPATDWDGHYALFNVDHTYSFTTTNDGDGGHAVSLSSGTTALWMPGRYDWTFYLVNKTNASKRKSLGTGKITVLPDPAQSTPMDGRTHSRRMLDAIEAVIENKATKNQLDLIRASHNGRDFESNPELLMKWRESYAAEVRREEQRDALARGERNRDMRVRVRF